MDTICNRGARRIADRRVRRSSLAAFMLSILVGAGAAVMPALSQAQSDDNDPKTMTVEELETFIAEQKEALERVRENREITAEKAREVREELAIREAKRGETEAELQTLCEEREALEPGTLADCLAQLQE